MWRSFFEKYVDEWEYWRRVADQLFHGASSEHMLQGPTVQFPTQPPFAMDAAAYDAHYNDDEPEVYEVERMSL